MSDLPVARDVSAVELLDRLLEKGVVLAGDVTISVAGVDLVYLGLRVLLSSAETAERFGAPVPSSAALEGHGLQSVSTDSSALGSSALDTDAFDTDAFNNDAFDTDAFGSDTDGFHSGP